VLLALWVAGEKQVEHPKFYSGHSLSAEKKVAAGCYSSFNHEFEQFFRLVANLLNRSSPFFHEFSSFWLIINSQKAIL
jgi:hypothetical protein